MGLINENIKFGKAIIGKIDIKNKFSFFEIEKKLTPKLLKNMEGKYFEGQKISIKASKDNLTKKRKKFKKKKRKK